MIFRLHRIKETSLWNVVESPPLRSVAEMRNDQETFYHFMASTRELRVLFVDKLIHDGMLIKFSRAPNLSAHPILRTQIRKHDSGEFDALRFGDENPQAISFNYINPLFEMLMRSLFAEQLFIEVLAP